VAKKSPKKPATKKKSPKYLYLRKDGRDFYIDDAPAYVQANTNLWRVKVSQLERGKVAITWKG